MPSTTTDTIEFGEEILPSRYAVPGTPNPDDSLSDEELDYADDIEDEAAALRRQEHGLKLAFAHGKASRERIAQVREDKAVVQAVRGRKLATVAAIMGLSSSADLTRAAPKADNDNSRYPGIVSSADFVRGFTPPDYHVDGVAQAGFIYALTASTGTGKTAVMLALTAATALGTSLCGRDVRKGRVLYLAGENPDDVRMRWLAMAHHMGFDPAEMDVYFIPGTFSVPGVIARVSEDVERLGGVDLVIVDTSAAYFQGDDENGNTPLGKHARELRQLCTLPGKPAVVVACHPTKNPDPTNLQPRGGGAFVAEIDGNLTLTKDAGMAKLHWQVKHRGADFVPLFFALESVTAPALVDSKGRSVPTVMAIGMADWKPVKASATELRGAAQKALAVLQDAGGSLATDDWRKAFYSEYPGDDSEALRKRFQRARKELSDAGAVTENGGTFSAGQAGHVPPLSRPVPLEGK